MTKPGIPSTPLPPRPSTPGVGPTQIKPSFLNSKPILLGKSIFAYRKSILFGLGVTVGIYK